MEAGTVSHPDQTPQTLARSPELPRAAGAAHRPEGCSVEGGSVGSKGANASTGTDQQQPRHPAREEMPLGMALHAGGLDAAALYEAPGTGSQPSQARHNSKWREGNIATAEENDINPVAPEAAQRQARQRWSDNDELQDELHEAKQAGASGKTAAAAGVQAAAPRSSQKQSESEHEGLATQLEEEIAQQAESHIMQESAEATDQDDDQFPCPRGHQLCVLRATHIWHCNACGCKMKKGREAANCDRTDAEGRLCFVACRACFNKHGGDNGSGGRSQVNDKEEFSKLN